MRKFRVVELPDGFLKVQVLDWWWKDIKKGSFTMDLDPTDYGVMKFSRGNNPKAVLEAMAKPPSYCKLCFTSWWDVSYTFLGETEINYICNILLSSIKMEK